MAKRADVIKGLEIAEKYDPGKWIDAQHDIIYIMDADVDLSAEDRSALEAAKFFVDEETDCWACFT